MSAHLALHTIPNMINICVIWAVSPPLHIWHYSQCLIWVHIWHCTQFLIWSISAWSGQYHPSGTFGILHNALYDCTFGILHNSKYDQYLRDLGDITPLAHLAFHTMPYMIAHLALYTIPNVPPLLQTTSHTLHIWHCVQCHLCLPHYSWGSRHCTFGIVHNAIVSPPLQLG